MRVTQQIVHDLCDQSPVPVYKRRLTAMLGCYNRKPWYAGKRPWPHIVIASFLLPYQKAATILHELGHHRCSETRCRCLSDYSEDVNDLVLNEAHAFAFGLRECLARDLTLSHRWSVKKILRMLDPDVCGVMYSAAVKIVTSRSDWGRHLVLATRDYNHPQLDSTLCGAYDDA